MSTIQDIAGMRWLVLCLLWGGRADYKRARDCFSRLHFLLSSEERETNPSRDEPMWETGLRNFQRDTRHGKHPYFEDVPDGLRLTPEGLKLIDEITGGKS